MENVGSIDKQLMERIKRIRAITKESTTSQSMEDRYKCIRCKDSGWVMGKNGYLRCSCYEKSCAEKLWQHFGVKPEEVRRINEFEVYDAITKNAKDKAINYINNFDNIKDKRENSYGLFGQPGSGKSHLIIGIGAALLKRENNPVSVIYMPYLEAMRELKANAMDGESYVKISSRYLNAKLLIIDDLFKDKVKNGQLIKDRYGQVVGLNASDMKHIYPIFNYRYLNHFPTLISTECIPQELLELDEALAGRILESCGDNITVFKGQQYDYRMRKFMK